MAVHKRGEVGEAGGDAVSLVQAGGDGLGPGRQMNEKPSSGAHGCGQVLVLDLDLDLDESKA